jgi:hypothetical protein
MNETLHQITQVGILAGVFTAMLAIGSHVPLGEILDALHDVRTLALALLANFVAVPLFAFVLVRLLPLEVEGREALLLLGATAGAPFLPKLATLAHGHVPFSIGLMVLLMVVTVGFAPLVLPLLLPEASVAPGEIAKSLLVMMLIPLLLGLLARARYPQIGDWSPELNRVSAACLAIGISAGLLVGWRAAGDDRQLDHHRHGTADARRGGHRLALRPRRPVAGRAARGGPGHGAAQLLGRAGGRWAGLWPAHARHGNECHHRALDRPGHRRRGDGAQDGRRGTEGGGCAGLAALAARTRHVSVPVVEMRPPHTTTS